MTVYIFKTILQIERYSLNCIILFVINGHCRIVAGTTGTLGTALQTIPYTYGDSNWKDKLTAYNGQTITYDAIGNPLSDGTWSYTWGAGRQLRQMSRTGMTVQFKYDHNGLRTQKMVTENGVTTTTNYVLHGKLITHMTRGTDSLHFFYDAQSRPAKVSFNGVMYTYVHNLQGDVTGIHDNEGNLVVEYKYDAWGKPTATVSTLITDLASINPLGTGGMCTTRRWDCITLEVGTIIRRAGGLFVRI